MKLSPSKRHRCPWVRVVVWLAAVVVGGQVVAEVDLESGDGILAGPWILFPGLDATYRVDDNIFRTEEDRVSDRILSTTAAIGALLPFRNSSFRTDYRATYLDYAKQDFSRDLEQEGGLALDLRFGTGDLLRLDGQYLKGISDVRTFDAGGEVTFEGQPFDLYAWNVILERDTLGRRGYRVGVQGSALNWVNREAVNFFDYRGVMADLEYREPLSRRFWLTLDIVRRDFDHFKSTDEVPGVPFRKEESRVYTAGLRGLAGRRQPFVVKLGYGDYEFPGTSPSQFQGVVGTFQWRIPVGAATSFLVRADRAVRPSFYSEQSYYIADSARVGYTQRLRQHSRVGANVLVGRNTYGDPEPTQQDKIRIDRRWHAEVFFDLMLNRVFGFRVSVINERRDSNFDNFSYDALISAVGVTAGW